MQALPASGTLHGPPARSAWQAARLIRSSAALQTGQGPGRRVRGAASGVGRSPGVGPCLLGLIADSIARSTRSHSGETGRQNVEPASFCAMWRAVVAFCRALPRRFP